MSKYLSIQDVPMDVSVLDRHHDEWRWIDGELHFRDVDGFNPWRTSTWIVDDHGPFYPA